jgi:hypothetical protein
MRLVVLFLLAAALGGQQGREFPRADERPEVRLPNGKSQRREMLKADHEKSKADAAELAALAQELKDDLEKSEYLVVDLKLVKKAEEIEKLARRIKDRMRRF